MNSSAGPHVRNLVFIMGRQRSGTTILYHALASAGPFACPDPFHIVQFDTYLSDPNFDPELALRSVSEQFSRVGITDRFIDEVAATPLTPEEYGYVLSGRRLCARNMERFERFCEFVDSGSPVGSRTLLKNPRDIVNIVRIRERFPRARFIFLHRRPGPTITSRIRALRNLFEGYSAYQALLEPTYRRRGRLNRKLVSWALRREAALTSYLLWEYRRDGLCLLTAMESLPDKSFISLNYEKLCARPKECLSEILTFLGLDSAPAAKAAGLIRAERGNRKCNLVLDSPWAERWLWPYLNACGYDGIWP